MRHKDGGGGLCQRTSGIFDLAEKCLAQLQPSCDHEGNSWWKMESTWVPDEDTQWQKQPTLKLSWLQTSYYGILNCPSCLNFFWLGLLFLIAKSNLTDTCPGKSTDLGVQTDSSSNPSSGVWPWASPQTSLSLFISPCRNTIKLIHLTDIYGYLVWRLQIGMAWSLPWRGSAGRRILTFANIITIFPLIYDSIDSSMLITNKKENETKIQYFLSQNVYSHQKCSIQPN